MRFMFTLVPFKWNSFVLHRLHIVIPNWCSFIIDCDGPFLSAFSHNSIPMSNCSVRYRRGPKKCINRSPIKSFLRFFPRQMKKKNSISHWSATIHYWMITSFCIIWNEYRQKRMKCVWNNCILHWMWIQLN